MNVTISSASVASLKAALKDTTRKLQAELKIAVNATANKSKSIINKEIRAELATTAKAIKPTIKVKSKATGSLITATVEVAKSARIPIKEFGARQTKKGISFRISKTQGRKTVSGGFQGPKPGLMKASWRGNAFKRVGQSRLPIVKLHGPSPWGVMTKGRKVVPAREQTQIELDKQIERRVRFVIKKKLGEI